MIRLDADRVCPADPALAAEPWKRHAGAPVNGAALAGLKVAATRRAYRCGGPGR